MKNVQPTKDTIYIDAEDEITAVIEKVTASDAKIIALVLPKRATTLQSVVNLKLLKRSAKEANKNLVLITSEAGLLPVAGAVGLHVAKTLQSKPYLPEAPKAAAATKAASATASEPPLDPNTSVGEHAGDGSDDTIDLDNDSKPDKKPTKSGKKSNKKFKIPDFNRFRLMLFGGIGLLIVLIVSGVFGLVILPKANITIKTDTQSVETDLTITAKTGVQEVDKEALIVPATKKEVKKTDNEKAAATGERNDGTKAAGTITFSVSCASVSSFPLTIPAGTGVSTSGLTFVTNSAVSLTSASGGGGGCTFSGSGAVTAQNAGDQYNLSAGRTFAVSGYSSVTGTNGSSMTGGTNKIVKVVSQSDVDSAKDKAVDRMTAAATQELKTQFSSESMIALDDSFTASNPAVTSTPAVNAEGNEVTVTVNITFSMLGVKEDDLEQIVEQEVNKSIDEEKQTIQDNGIDTAAIIVTEKKSPDEMKFNFKTIVIAGPELDEEGIKQDVAGKSRTETEKIINERPGIKEVTVDYSPFWVFSTPKKTDRITITFDQNNAQ